MISHSLSTTTSWHRPACLPSKKIAKNKTTGSSWQQQAPSWQQAKTDTFRSFLQRGHADNAFSFLFRVAHLFSLIFFSSCRLGIPLVFGIKFHLSAPFFSLFTWPPSYATFVPINLACSSTTATTFSKDSSLLHIPSVDGKRRRRPLTKICGRAYSNKRQNRI